MAKQDSPPTVAPRESHSPATVPGYNKGKRPGNAGKRWPSEVLEPSDIAALINVCSKISATGKRNAAIIAVLYRTGIKVSELVELMADDYNSGEFTLAIRAKGSKRRTVGLDPYSVSLLGYWMDARRKLGLLEGPLFSSLHGTRLYEAYVRAMLARLAAHAGIAKRVHPNAFRVTHVAELVNEGESLTLIQQVLGLATLGATEHYLAELNLPPVNPVKTQQERPWRARPDEMAA